MTIKYLTLSSLAVAVGMAVNPALAQGGGNQNVLEEVVVTATKRSESIQDVPFSISAISGDALRDRGVTNMTEALRWVPGVSIGFDFPTNTLPVVRGMFPTALSDSTTAVYLDEVQIALPVFAQVPSLGVVDLERVEVVRGPQGTLYGASAMGGAIRVITRDPDFESVNGLLSVEGSSMSGGEENYRVDGAINIPLGDTLAMRVAAGHKNFGGFMDGDEGSEDFDSTKVTNLRAKLLWQPSDQFSAKLTIDHTDIETFSDNQGTYKNTTQKGQALVNIFYESGLGPQFTQWDDDYTIASLTLKYDMGDIALENTTSYYDKNGSEGPGVNTVTAGGIPAVIGFGGKNGGKSKGNEFRAMSTTDSPLQWVGGFTVNEGEYYLGIGGVSYTFMLDPAIVPPPYNVLGFPGAESGTKSKSWAVFGELSYAFMDNRLVALIGGRYFEDDRDFLDAEGVLSATYDEFSPRFNLSYEVNDDVNVYFNAAKGFRSGLFQNGQGRIAATLLGKEPGPVDPDVVWTYEAGVKASLAGGRLYVEAGYFYSDWNDMQYPIRISGLSVNENAGDATIQGFEGALTWNMPIEGMQLLLAGSVIDTEFKNVDPGMTAGAPAIVDGAPIPGVAEWSFSSELSYSRAVRDGLTLDAAISYLANDGQPDVSGGVSAITGEFFPSTDQWNELGLRLGVSTDTWSITAFGNNLTDNDKSRTANQGVVYAVPRPRTIGVRLGYNF